MHVLTLAILAALYPGGPHATTSDTSGPVDPGSCPRAIAPTRANGLVPALAPAEPLPIPTSHQPTIVHVQERVTEEEETNGLSEELEAWPSTLLGGWCRYRIRASDPGGLHQTRAPIAGHFLILRC